MDIYGYWSILLVFVLLVLEGIRFFLFHEKTNRKRMVDMGGSMTIGNREIQEDRMAFLTTSAGTMAVLADGSGQTYGGRIAAQIAVQTCEDVFQDYHAFNNPQYFFRKAFNCANREILKELGDKERGTASVGCVLIRQDFLYYVSNRRLSRAISADYFRRKHLSQSAVNEAKAHYIGCHRRLSRAYFSSAMAGLK